MRYVWLGFHIIMLIAVIAAFSGAFSPPRPGTSIMQQGPDVGYVIGLIAIWIVGSIILRAIRKFKSY